MDLILLHIRQGVSMIVNYLDPVDSTVRYEMMKLWTGSV